MKRSVVLIAVAALTWSVSAYGQARRPHPRCLHYLPDTIEVRGRLRRHVFAGPPNYESVQRGDSAEAGFYLHLGTPVCFAGDSASPTAYPQGSVRLIQLNLDSVDYARLRPYLGRRISLRGHAYASHTGHHHAPVIFYPDVWPASKPD